MGMKKKLVTTTILAGITAAAGAVLYKMNKDQKKFTTEKWDTDISKRFKMADSLIRSEVLIGKKREDVLSILGINGLKSNSKDTIEYYLNLDSDEPKLLIINFDEEEKVTGVTACV